VKNVYFNRKDGILRNLGEKPVPKKKINWDKLLYFFVLLLILFFVFKFFFTRMIYVTAPGQVLFKSLKIRVPDDITIRNFYKIEGDSVTIGDTLFSYTSFSDEREAFSYNLSATGGSNGATESWAQKEIYQLNKTISLNTISIEEKYNLIQYYKSQITTLKNEVILEITPKSKIEFYEKEIEKMELEIQSIQKENQVYNKLIQQLQQLEPAVKKQTGFIVESKSSLPGTTMAGVRYYVSPIQGHITRLYKNDYEVALKSEDILNVHEKKDIYIKAFFEQDDIAYLKEGDEVTVIFPDGETSIGHIKRFYFATYILPDEFQKKYESTTRAIAVDIFPIENESEIKWKAFYKMNVTVRINKWK
jgi:hypothetical protein